MAHRARAARPLRPARAHRTLAQALDTRCASRVRATGGTSATRARRHPRIASHRRGRGAAVPPRLAVLSEAPVRRSARVHSMRISRCVVVAQPLRRAGGASRALVGRGCRVGKLVHLVENIALAAACAAPRRRGAVRIAPLMAVTAPGPYGLVFACVFGYVPGLCAPLGVAQWPTLCAASHRPPARGGPLRRPVHDRLVRRTPCHAAVAAATGALLLAEFFHRGRCHSCCMTCRLYAEPRLDGIVRQRLRHNSRGRRTSRIRTRCLGCAEKGTRSPDPDAAQMGIQLW